MVSGQAVIINARGLHARPAARLAKLAAQFDANITVTQGRKKADAKSIASLLMLAAANGAKLTIEADGKNASQAVSALLQLIASGFEDDAVANNPQAPEALPATKKKKSKMYKVYGIGVGEAHVTGHAHIHISGSATVPRYHIHKQHVKAELKRYDDALQTVRHEIENLRAQAEKEPDSADITPFIDLYAMFLQDAEFAKKPQALIKRRNINAEWALKERVDVFNDRFRRVTDDYLRERGRDIEHVMHRLLTAMKPDRRKKIHAQSAHGAHDKRILAAADLDPADLIRVRQEGYQGIVTESGSATSHIAILARSMNIPAVLAARGVLKNLKHGDVVLLDPEAQTVIVKPDDDTLEKYKKQAGKKKRTARQRGKKSKGHVFSKDGERLFLHTNIDMPDELDAVLKTEVDGVGLLRTEFLFINREELPGEDEQFEVYRHVLKKMQPLPVVIRTLDLGGDKLFASEHAAPRGSDSALGVRAIRYCLEMPDLFLTQLRALLRASAECKNLKVLFPMLSHPMELEKTVTILRHAQEQLRVVHRIDCPPPPIGGMIEVPAAVFIMRMMAGALDFFSIGTNDLIQYTMAVDRNNDKLTKLCDPLHPAILHLLYKIVTEAKSVNRPVTLCGELAGDAEMTRLMLALGLRHLSMNTHNLDAVRGVIERTDCNNLSGFARDILRAQHSQAARTILQKINDA